MIHPIIFTFIKIDCNGILYLTQKFLIKKIGYACIINDKFQLKCSVNMAEYNQFFTVFTILFLQGYTFLI